jgi:tetratricopeptide (TPR) repeat protein
MRIFRSIANSVSKIFKITEDIDEAKRLGKLRNYRSAIKILEQLKERTDGTEGFFVSNSLREIDILLKEWKPLIERADELIQQAKKQMYLASSDPLHVESIEKALSLYSQANKLIDEVALDGEIKKCNLEYHKRNRFKYLLGVARQYIGKGEFQRALVDLTEAKKLYDTDLLTTEINNCKSNIELEIQYEAQLVNIRKVAQEGSFSEAISLLETALTKFSNSDGLALKAKLDRIVKGRFYFLEGLKAENANHYSLAESLYLKAIKELPELTESKIRLAVILIKTFDYSKAIFELRDIQSEKANYLRGFAYAQQGKFQEANKAWQTCKNPEIQEQRLMLKTLIQQQQAQTILKIETYISEGKLEEAELESQALLENYGFNEIVQRNLEKYIQPCLAKKGWETRNWKIIYSKCEQDWRNKLDIESLHNWAVAAYY